MHSQPNCILFWNRNSTRRYMAQQKELTKRKIIVCLYSIMVKNHKGNDFCFHRGMKNTAILAMFFTYPLFFLSWQFHRWVSSRCTESFKKKKKKTERTSVDFIVQCVWLLEHVKPFSYYAKRQKLNSSTQTLYKFTCKKWKKKKRETILIFRNPLSLLQPDGPRDKWTSPRWKVKHRL